MHQYCHLYELNNMDLHLFLVSNFLSLAYVILFNNFINSFING